MRILRIRVAMDELGLRSRKLDSSRPRITGRNARVEVVGPDGEVLGLLACTAFHVECTGRDAPVRAHVTCDVAEVDLLAIESEPLPEEERHG